MDIIWMLCCVCLFLVKMVIGGEKVTATCEMKDNTNAGATTQGITGTVNFEQEGGGDTTIKIDLMGFNTTDPETKHGFHIHIGGDMGNDCNKNEGHYNPTNDTHGAPDAAVRHYGDLGNIVEDASGNVKKTMTDRFVTLIGDNTVIGRSVMVHFTEDDLGLTPNDPESLKTGNAGARLACCVITASTEQVTPNSVAFTRMGAAAIVASVLLSITWSRYV